MFPFSLCLKKVGICPLRLLVVWKEHIRGRADSVENVLYVTFKTTVNPWWKNTKEDRWSNQPTDLCTNVRRIILASLDMVQNAHCFRACPKSIEKPFRLFSIWVITGCAKLSALTWGHTASSTSHIHSNTFLGSCFCSFFLDQPFYCVLLIMKGKNKITL